MFLEDYWSWPVEKQVSYMERSVRKMVDAGEYNLFCISGEPVFFVGTDHAYVPGHIYSESGAKEFDISRMCEFHFDELTKDWEAV